MKDSPGYGVFVDGRFRRCRGDRPVCPRTRGFCSCSYWYVEHVRCAKAYGLTFSNRDELHNVLIGKLGWTSKQAAFLSERRVAPPKLQVLKGGRA